MIYQKLKEHRTKKGLTQQEMASKIGMEQTTYSKKERGLSTVTPNEWQRFAKLLETTVEEINVVEQNIPKNEHCTFNDQAIGIQISNMQENMLEIMKKYIQKLEEEIVGLKARLGE